VDFALCRKWFRLYFAQWMPFYCKEQWWVGRKDGIRNKGLDSHNS
jgi:hypothetical protein